jgi:hypothetical protein
MIQSKFDSSGRVRDGVMNKPLTSRVDTFGSNTVAAYKANLNNSKLTTLNSELSRQNKGNVEKTRFDLGIF